MIRHSPMAKLIVLSLVHFCVDFYAGVIVPLPEPTLTRHLGVGLPMITLIIGCTAFLINLVQPLGGWLLPKRGIPVILLIAPPTAALAAAIGLTHSVAVTTGLLVLSSIAIGIVHPEAALASCTLSGRKQGLGMGFFISGGYLGFATGSLISGIWVERFNQDISHLWILSLPALGVVTLVLYVGLHRIQGHSQEDQNHPTNTVPFALTLTLAVCIAVFNLILVRLITIYLVRSFPGQDAQAWGGATVFALGITGALGAFLWGYFSDRFGCARMILMLSTVGIPFYYMFLRIDSPQLAPVLGAIIGLTLGGTFPLTVVLARRAKGTAHRLRIGLSIGGAWGTGELVFVLAGKYIGGFPPTEATPVMTVFKLCWVLIACSILLAFVIDRREQTLAPQTG